MKDGPFWLVALSVGSGAAIGAVLRWALSYALNPKWATLPLGTLSANLIGAYLIGLAAAAGIPVPKSFVAGRETPKDALYTFGESAGYPLFVKPVRAGSSFGVTKVSCRERLPAAVGQAFAYDDHVILEENIEGFEVGCAVMGTDSLTTGQVDEIELSGDFFDFEEKYTLKTSAIYVPARIAPGKAHEIRETAKRIYKALGCSGFARVDMFLTPQGKIYFNEVNTIPGFTQHSRFPGMMKAAGISFEEILDRIIGEAVRE